MLPFLPLDDISDTQELLKHEMPAEMETFCDYVEATWIGTPSKRPLFDHASWNHHEDTLLGLPRSSNIVEGWNNSFNSMLSCSHPSIWKFLECLGKEQNLTDQKITMQLVRHPPPARRKKWINYDATLERVIRSYHTFDDGLEFLEAMAAVV